MKKLLRLWPLVAMLFAFLAPLGCIAICGGCAGLTHPALDVGGTFMGVGAHVGIGARNADGTFGPPPATCPAPEVAK